MKKARRGARLLGALETYLRDPTGSAAVEFSLVVWPFLLLFMGGLQVFVIFLMNNIIQTAAQQAGRSYMTGNQQSETQAQFATAVCNFLPAGLFNCTNLMVDEESSGTAASLNESAISPQYTYNPVTHTWTLNPNLNSSGGSWGYTASTPEQYVILRVMYDLPVIFSVGFGNQPDGSYLMSGTSVFLVEPYNQ